MVWRAPLAPDLDLYLHLKTGELATQTRALVKQDVFTFTARGENDETHSWLSQIILWNVYRVTSETGLKLLHATLLIGTLALLARGALASGLSSLLTIALLLAALLVQKDVLVLRPLLFGQLLFFLLAFFTWTSTSRFRPLWVFLTVTLWGNLHGSVLMALPLVAFLFALTPTRRNFYALLAAVPAVFLNPSGIDLPGQAFAIARIGKEAGIFEWIGRRPLFIEPMNAYVNRLHVGLTVTDFICFLGFLALAKCSRKHLLPLGTFVFCVLPLFASRNIIWLGLPIVFLAIHFRSWAERLRVPLLMVLLMAAARIPKATESAEHQALKRAVSYIKSTQYHGDILNFSGWGAYLSFAGYPEWRTLADRRLWVNRGYYAYESQAKKLWGGLHLRELATRHPQAKLAIFHEDASGGILERAGWLKRFSEGGVAVWEGPGRTEPRLTRSGR